MQQPNKPQPEPRKPGLSLTGRALALLSRREHSRPELERKLASYAESPEQLASVLDALQAKGFISEARVVESLLNRRASRLGAARIRQELQAKGVGSQAVQEAMEQLADSELERARAVWRKKFAEPATTPHDKAKQMRFLLGRGFAPTVVRQILNPAD
ncbi:recombination regulator RecX [Curvibacter sp. CHRR-16]|uniref:recombination regulator RecX n=1 Tax=Curvibacter sp. CHRR-16 TaxID=2835872 RepID=UPI001BDB114A|nr:recombination regulator RecX [Curvibacter sp. CHRR-16]MBT0570407.1 recombination regulator RecX [Curvibacter sp. CHRR-16]